MKINYLFCGGFLILSLFIVAAGYINLTALENHTEELKISNTIHNLFLNIFEHKEYLYKYLLTEDSDTLSDIKEIMEEQKEAVDVTIAKLTARLSQKTKQEHNEIKEKNQKIAVLWESAHELEFELRTNQDRYLAIKREFNKEYLKEEEKRYALQEAVYFSNDSILLKDIGKLSDYGKEALFQYKDEKHINVWLESITRLKTNIRIKGEEGMLTAAKSRTLSSNSEEYYNITEKLGNLILEQIQIENQKKKKLTEFNELIKEINKNNKYIQSSVSVLMMTTTENMNNIFWRFTALALLLIICLALLIAFLITKPIQKLTYKLTQITKGKFDIHLDKSKIYEIQELTNSLNRILASMKLAILRGIKKEDLGIGTVIKAKEKAEKQLQESKNKYKELYQASRDAIMILAPPTWKFTAGNKATVDLFNTKTEEKFIKTAPWQLSPKYQPDGQLSSVKAKKMIGIAMKKRSNFFEWTHKKLNGKPFDATVLLTRIKIEGKNLLQATVRDITKRKKTEKSFKDMEQKYKRLSKKVKKH